MIGPQPHKSRQAISAQPGGGETAAWHFDTATPATALLAATAVHRPPQFKFRR